MTKNAERREKFRRIGEAISRLKKTGDPDAPDYLTGIGRKFEMKRTDAHHREEGRIEVPLGPSFRTPQWVPTTK